MEEEDRVGGGDVGVPSPENGNQREHAPTRGLVSVQVSFPWLFLCGFTT